MRPIVGRQVGGEADRNLVFEITTRRHRIAQYHELDAPGIALRFAEETLAINLGPHFGARIIRFERTQHDHSAGVALGKNLDGSELSDRVIRFGGESKMDHKVHLHRSRGIFRQTVPDLVGVFPHVSEAGFNIPYPNLDTGQCFKYRGHGQRNGGSLRGALVCCSGLVT